MTGEDIEDDEIEVGDVDSLRPRYELVITRHIEMMLEDGRFDARAPVSEPLSDRCFAFRCCEDQLSRLSQLAEASRLYEIGQELESNPENAGKLASEVDEIVDDLFKQVQLERRTSFGRFLLPQKSEDSKTIWTTLNFQTHPTLTISWLFRPQKKTLTPSQVPVSIY